MRFLVLTSQKRWHGSINVLLGTNMKIGNLKDKIKVSAWRRIALKIMIVPATVAIIMGTILYIIPPTLKVAGHVKNTLFQHFPEAKISYAIECLFCEKTKKQIEAYIQKQHFKKGEKDETPEGLTAANEKMREKFPIIEGILSSIYPNGEVHLRIRCATPTLLVNGKYVVDRSGRTFHPSEFEDFPLGALKQVAIADFDKDNYPKILDQLVRRTPESIWANYIVQYEAPWQIYCVPKDPELRYMVRCDDETLNDTNKWETLERAYQNAQKNISKEKQKLARVVLDIRFENQIVINTQ